MKVDVVMPKMGESVNEGTIIKWHKKKGDKVEKDEIIFEISTDKVDTEIPAPESGTLVEIRAYEQETVEAEEVVAVIDTENGAVEEDGNKKESKKEKSSDDEEKRDEPDEDEVEDEEEEEPEPSTTQVGGDVVDITMPKMGESVMEGTIIKWHKKEGDKVEKDEILFEISTDKVDTEVPSPEDGTLVEIITGENETVEVGETVARVSKSGGLRQQTKKSGDKEKKAAAKEAQKESHEISEEPDREKRPTEADVKEDAKEEKPEGRFYSPLVMNIAHKEGISMDELSVIEGSGTGGRLTKKDVLSYLEDREKGGKKARETKPGAKETFKPVQKGAPKGETREYEQGKVEKIPMDNIRKRIMYHMTESRDTSVHVTAVIEVDMSKIHNYLKANKETVLKREGVKLTYMAFIAYAVIKALREYPYLNASIEEENIVLKKFINLGVAVAVEPNGLIVPNIKHADEKNIKGLSRTIVDLSNKARNKGLIPEDIMDGTFTITNYGVFGSLFGTPIINQPEVGILGVGAVQKKPVVVEVDGADTIAIKPMMYLSLAHDHRLVDGMLGGKFLAYVKEILENFDTNQI